MTEYCTNCDVLIQPFITGQKTIDNEVYCKKCFYLKLGNLIEKYPIGFPFQ